MYVYPTSLFCNHFDLSHHRLLLALLSCFQWVFLSQHRSKVTDYITALLKVHHQTHSLHSHPYNNDLQGSMSSLSPSLYSGLSHTRFLHCSVHITLLEPIGHHILLKGLFALPICSAQNTFSPYICIPDSLTVLKQCLDVTFPMNPTLTTLFIFLNF